MQQIIRQGVKLDALPSTVTIDYTEPEVVPESMKTPFQKVTNGIEQVKQGGDVVSKLTDIIVQLQKDVADICAQQQQE